MKRRATRLPGWPSGQRMLRGMVCVGLACTSLSCVTNHAAHGGSNVDEAKAITSSETRSTLEVAEAFIDAFYSWDADALARMMDAGEDGARALYYQGWAEAGHYVVQKRRPCQKMDDGRLQCSITVVDDIGQALGYVATDVFRLSIEGRRVVGVDFDSDDPPIFDELFAWIAKDRPEVLTGPCRDLFAGGKTPAACVRAVVQAARDFARLT